MSKLEKESIKSSYQAELSTRLQHLPSAIEGIQDTSRSIRECVNNTGKTELGALKKMNPDWFQENEDIVKPLIIRVQECHANAVKYPNQTA